MAWSDEKGELWESLKLQFLHYRPATFVISIQVKLDDPLEMIPDEIGLGMDRVLTIMWHLPGDALRLPGSSTSISAGSGHYRTLSALLATPAGLASDKRIAIPDILTQNPT
ncbi:hypothetical protein MJO28_010809 [Puccinia striiformis f. sp. tritici]|uniref:Uncharacterized protein n=1 Tax=Puccinia striiformis f. sp. tritici TaxID=168172 RepID=A0ACC0E756_9BASI|nr:hypothetical protein MJO28_010809 [Puccinia striiformis f. sp. tritici]